MLTWEETWDELAEGRVESKEPGLAECLRECVWLLVPEKEEEEGETVGGRVSGDEPFRGWSPEEREDEATDLAAAWAVDTCWCGACGREKFCRLLVLLLGCAVKLL